MNSRFYIITLLLVISVRADENFVGRWEKYLKNDFKTGLTRISFRNTLYATGFLAGMFIMSYSDESILRGVQEHYKGDLKKYFDVTNELGNVRITGPVALGLAGASLLAGNSRLQDAAFTSLEALFVSGGIVTAIKYIAGRSRPFQGNGAHRYRPFSGDTAFPSGHASTAWALVTPWVLYYPGIWTYGMLIFPAGTAVARIARNAHWATDVIAGSLIGFIVASALTHWHRDSAQPNRLTVTMDGTQLRLQYVL